MDTSLSWIKKLFPKTLLGRSLVILVTPVLLMPSVMTYICIDHHLTKITDLLALNVAGNAAAAADFLAGTDYEESLQSSAIPFMQERFHITLAILPPTHQIPTPPHHALSKTGWVEKRLYNALNEQLNIPFKAHVNNEETIIDIYSLHKDIRLIFPTKRLFSKTTMLLFWWALITPFLFLCIAAIFMKNQVRPLKHLSDVVDAFGKGRDKGTLRPSGAQEVRKVARAFNAMRERIKRQIEQRTQMLAGVSHDLRTPLTRMELQLAIMEQTPDVAALRGDLKDMGVMLEVYLAFARGEADEVIRTIDLKELLNFAIKPSERKHITLTPVETPCILTGKRNALQRCVMNIVQNGLRYAPHIWIRVKIKKQGIYLFVDDNGPGIPENMYEEIFKPFVRLETSRNIQTGGTGLGLSIARDVARSHGGEITLQPSKKGGLRVIIFLPH